MKKNKAMVKKKKRDNLKKSKKKMNVLNPKEVIQVACSGENGEEIILYDKTDEFIKSFKE